MVGDKPWPQVSPNARSHTETSVLIIGAGLSGICTAIDLIKRNQCHDFVIVEKSSGVGGVWHDNRYPGCGCDVWSALYSFSFEQNPNWTREYPGQEELLRYIVDTAQKYKIFKHIRFGTTVEEATWDDRAHRWRTRVSVASGIKDHETTAGYEISSDFVVSAVGQLNQPKWPDVPGLDKFEGRKMHSARWDWSYDLQNKTVAIIGNGCSSVQILPEIVDYVKHITVYQRSPHYIVPRMDRPLHSFERGVYKYVRPLLWLKRAIMMDFREALHPLITNQDSNAAKGVRDYCIKAIEQSFPNDPGTQQKLIPKYAPGAKRTIASDDYYPALAKPQTTLETRPIHSISGKSIIVTDENGKQIPSENLDLVICATGFKTVDFLSPIKFHDKNGHLLSDTWNDGARALYGVTAENMPNFAMLYGPNTNLGHSSIVLMIEAQSRYINGLIKPVLDAKKKGGALALYPKRSVLDDYNRILQEKLLKSSWNDPNCKSWYRNEAGLIVNNWTGTVVEYQELLSKVNFGDFVVDDSTHTVSEDKVINIGRVVEETHIARTVGLLGIVSTGVIAAGWAMRHSQYLKQLLS